MIHTPSLPMPMGGARRGEGRFHVPRSAFSPSGDGVAQDGAEEMETAAAAAARIG